MTGKQRVREILKQYAHIDNTELGEDKFAGHYNIEQALDSIEEIVKEVLGKNEPNPFTEDYDFRNPVEEAKKVGRNRLRSVQLGRWSDKINGA